jgi:diadenosine tetraphosphatase ApaH/serine/threonine PP2A family protein phosphatase
VTLVHGSPRDPVWEYVTSLPIARTNLAVLETPVGLHGHTHVPMAWTERDGRIDAIAPGPGSSLELADRRALLNPGSVGQPRDGDPSASWLELDTEAGSAVWRRAAYDVEVVRSAIRDTGLPPRLGDRLRMGL